MSKHLDANARRYEMMFIIQPVATETNRKALLEEVRGYIKETGASIFHEDDWGLRDFAYRIKGFDNGYYYIFYFEGAKPDMLKELENNMILNQALVRHLVTSLPKDWELKSYELEDEVDEMIKDKPKPQRKVRKKVEASADKPAEPAPEVDKQELDKKLDEIMKDDDLGL